jgi:hypothetical protein
MRQRRQCRNARGEMHESTTGKVHGVSNPSAANLKSYITCSKARPSKPILGIRGR